MIHCPKCDAANRRGSRFCNECGEPLPMRTALRCPMCGTMNPVGNVYCDSCHARLIPMAASPSEETGGTVGAATPPIKGLSLPTISLDESGGQPLDDLPTGFEPEGAETEDWLAQFRGPEPDGEIAETPPPAASDDWLGQLRDTEPAAAPAPAAGDDWLTQLRDTEPAEASAPPPAGGDDWLTQLRDTEPVGEPVESVELPDWLQDRGPMGVEAEPGVTEEPPVEMDEPAASAPVLGDVPDLGETLDWLPDIAQEAAAPAAAAPSAPAPTPTGTPDWLQEIGPEETAAPAPTLGDTPDFGETPDWLQDIAQEAAAPSAPAPTPAGTPDWLQEIGPEETAAPAPTLGDAPDFGETPDWLQDIAPDEPPAPTPTGTPDWLQDIAPEEAAPPTATMDESAAPTPAAVPDWLQDIAPEEAAPPTATMDEPTASALGDVPDFGDVPDWLQEVAPKEAFAPEEAFAPIVRAEPPPTAAMPDWLRDIAAEEEIPPKAATAVSPLMDLPVDTGPSEDLEWLAELETEARPAPSAPVPAFTRALGLEGAGEELARADLPAWMEALRPQSVDAAAEAPVETAGLLQGLRGVLSPDLAVEVPAGPEEATPSEQVQASLSRAQLLQSLLTLPAEAPEAGSRVQGPRVSERVQRGLVSAVLFLTVLAMVLLPHLEIDLPLLTEVGQGSQEQITELFNTIEGLQASTGATVLVAFEYGPAEADELDPVAAPILAHLIDRGAYLIPVSTRAEGKAIAHRLLTSIASASQYTETRYAPGDAVGVSQLLASVDAASASATSADMRPQLVLVLTAQPGPLRWWVEQSSARGDRLPPIAAGLSAALEPAASPYLDMNAGQIRGAVSGLSGAAAYEKLRGQEGEATKRVNILAVVQIAIVGLMIIGAAIYAASGLRRRKT